MEKSRNNCRVALALAALVAMVGPDTVRASDHRETPTTLADAIADIADVYTWHEGGRFVVVMTTDGKRLPTAAQTARYDAEVRYQIHIGRDGFAASRTAAVNIGIRLEKQASGAWKVFADNVPGSGGTISGTAGTTIDKGSAKLFIGLRDDPFFFDLEGFNSTVSTGTLMFDSARDSFAGTNCTAIVIEMDLNEVRNGSNKLYVWGTTTRKDN